jgi:FtsH-binding integral membrane protein
MNTYQEPITTIIDSNALSQSAFIRQVFAWMSFALFVSAALAYLVTISPAAQKLIFGTPFAFIGLIIVEFGLVIYLSARITEMSLATARIALIVYAALNGITLSTIFFAYTASSIANTFLVAGGTFAAMALFGYVTKRDLTSWGHLLMMFLFGIIIAGVVNIFLHSATLYWTTTVIGIGLFVGLTAYDTQKIKNMALGGGTLEGEQKGAILGALILYLDFVNLFLFLLRIFGRRK